MQLGIGLELGKVKRAVPGTTAPHGRLRAEVANAAEIVRQARHTGRAYAADKGAPPFDVLVSVLAALRDRGMWPQADVEKPHTVGLYRAAHIAPQRGLVLAGSGRRWMHDGNVIDADRLQRAQGVVGEGVESDVVLNRRHVTS